jgi:cellulose synthase/poly-beta-1,6-N-acetylglucosamine synthase-like glycosyltransferase
MLQLIFWILIGIVFYSYFGYTLLLMVFAVFKMKKNTVNKGFELPEVTLLIAAYNEKDIIPSKIENSNQLEYPKEKLHQLWITDGSTDGSVDYLKSIPGIEVLHLPDRKGKTAAINRAMVTIKTPVTILCDANSMLSPMAVKELVTSFYNDSVGCVAGEKRIVTLSKDKAAGAGEGFYWNYESLIKKLESGFGSTLGAAGELYAIRTNLYQAPAENIILDDFVVSLKIAEKGFKINYQPEAFASESSSFSIKEEMKRKIRIAAGSFQVLFGMPSLLNFFKHFRLSFQYFSHKVLRWLIVPFALPVLILTNLLLATSPNVPIIYVVTLALQVAFYLMVLAGSMLNEKVTRFKLLFFPFYIAMMNYCIVLGLFRFLGKSQNAAWEKVRRNDV